LEQVFLQMFTIYLPAETVTLTYSQAIVLLLSLIAAVAIVGRWGVNKFQDITPHRGRTMRNYDPHPGISMHHIRVGSGITGLLFTIACSVIFLGRIPVLRYFLAMSILVGIGIAAVLIRSRR
jgi:hypothetical protein